MVTIQKRLASEKIYNVELTASDSSIGMISYAEARAKEWKDPHLTINFTHGEELANEIVYDVIATSLVLPYAASKNEMLGHFFQHLKPNGLLVSSHWPHPSQVPFLTLIKRVGIFMATGQRISLAQLDSDGSFSCWPEGATRACFVEAGFNIEHWTTVDLPMSFADIRSLLSFCRVASWFQDPRQYSVAEQEASRILQNEYKVTLHPDGSFDLNCAVVVVVASK